MVGRTNLILRTDMISKSKMKKSFNVRSKCHQVLSKAGVNVMYKTLVMHLRCGKK